MIFICQIYYLWDLFLIIFNKTWWILNLLSWLILISLRDVQILNLFLRADILLSTLYLLIIKIIELKVLKIFNWIILLKLDCLLFNLLLLLFLIFLRQFFFLLNIKIHILLDPNFIFLIKELLIINYPILFV